MGMATATDVQLAMSIIQLTAVALPLLLGFARYLTQHPDIRPLLGDAAVPILTSMLGTMVFLASVGPTILLLRHGNGFILVSIGVYLWVFIVSLAVLIYLVHSSYGVESRLPIIVGVFLGIALTVTTTMLFVVSSNSVYW